MMRQKHAKHMYGHVHDWTVEDLKAELSAGQPVVVALGNGESTVGHFVTVTGVSGGQVAYNDPTLGKQVISTEEFLRLPALPARPGWSREGNSGVAVRREAPAGDSAGSAAWVAAGAALMALISQTPLALRRKGIGGRLDVSGVGAGRGPAPSGYRWVQRQTPKYEWQEVQEGWDIVPKTVPNMVRRYKQVGWTTEIERIPRYETVQVQEGWTYTYERVATYRTERYIQYWRTEYTNQATFRYVGGMRVFAGYKRVARRVPVYGTRRVFAGYRTERKRVPRMVERRVLAGWDYVEKRVPKYEWQEVQEGWTTETVRIPNMVRRQVQVGTETRWVLERVPQRPHLEFNLQGSNPPVSPQSNPDPEDPPLVPVPSFLSDPLGWFQATMINAGRSSETARSVLVAANDAWNEYAQSVVDASMNFVAGFGYQTIRNNAEPLAWISMAIIPSAREDIPSAMRDLESDPMFDSTAFRLGRIAGSIGGLVESAFLIVTGAGEIGVGSTACGTGVLCWAGAGAVALGSGQIAAGSSVGLVSVRDLVGQVVAISSRGGRAGRGSWERLETEYGDIIEARRLSDSEVRGMDLHEAKLEQGYHGRDAIYIDRSGGTWIQSQHGGPLVDFP